MKCSSRPSRRAVVAGLALLGLPRRDSRAQGFAGLGRDATGFATVEAGRALRFPADHGAHPDFRIEWWYVTANLKDAAGAEYGAQWTLFRQAMAPGPQQDGWASQQVWMGHAAVTSSTAHRFAETLSRGGIGVAGVEPSPLRAWIDAWQLRGGDEFDAATMSPIALSASGADFSYALRLDAAQPLVLQGEAGYSEKSERGQGPPQASYYYSQPFFRAAGRIVIDGQPIDVGGMAWADREWSSQPLGSGQTGWDWLSLHLDGGDKLMLFRLRQQDGADYLSGNWIGHDGSATRIRPGDIALTPTATTDLDRRAIPTSWRVEVASRRLRIDTTPVNATSWMGASVPYWEGPIRFAGSHGGVGYLEMTGY